MTRDELIDILHAHGGHFDCSIEHVADEIMEAMGDVQTVAHDKCEYEPEEEVTTEFEQGYDVGYNDAIEDIRFQIKKLEIK